MGIVLAACGLAPSIALADVQTGKVFMVMENQLAVMDSAKNEMHRFDISMAAVYRNGLLAAPAALANGDWVTVTTEMQDGRLVATLVEASSDR
jgi:hypothetical protein